MPNVSDFFTNQLPSLQRHLLRRVADAASRRHVDLFIVGGTVRDILLGLEPTDLDLSVSTAPSDFSSYLANQLNGEVIARSQFGTAKLQIEGVAIDLAITRKETYAHPGALPTVEAAGIEEDLARRDFSINAMAIQLGPDTWGDLVDPFGGQRDLEAGLVRTLDTRSFINDATRILRAVRYTERLNFNLETATKTRLTEDLTYLDTIKGDRVRREFERIFRERLSGPMMAAAQRLGVLSAIYPMLNLDEPLLQTVHSISAGLSGDNDLILLSLMAFAIPSGRHAGFIRRLSMNGHWAEVVRDTSRIKARFRQLAVAKLKNSQVYQLLQRANPIAVKGCALATHESQIADRLSLYETKLRYVKGILHGGELMALGVRRGPMIGELIDALLAARLDELVATREDEEKFVSEILRQS